ncbi:uncharacterized protein ATNIH1004_002600 [Aspergillus tanneri]|uniref:Uncharacterized protein n=1 Tax=Aspergillus tanneri TaxID=1220188 RepID=A0A5M9MS40_9EURO|nr:uncharacterized protein ATNIH1004_002600 [Aspergillus tanneri]KAA8649921.1 hypothetical protein ATNIH1004_002600 [Aspergillus tanneri]
MAFRLFVGPRIGPQKSRKSVQPLFSLRGEPELAKAANKVGFRILEGKPIDGNSVVPALRCVLETLFEGSGKEIKINSASKTAYIAKRFQEIFSGPASNQSRRSLVLSVDPDTLKPSYRAGPPLRQEYVRDRAYFFLQQIYGSDQNGLLYPSSFAVMRDVFSFFSREPLFNPADKQNLPGSPGLQQVIEQIPPSSPGFQFPRRRELCWAHLDNKTTSQRSVQLWREKRILLDCLPGRPLLRSGSSRTL